jgi:EAL domain-containing protein (putative c-di-GMP-specific phosphodiesterase class I)/ActR/RegA family two-component response regulator
MVFAISQGNKRPRMNRNITADGRRILLIDDNPAIHQDFKKIFGPGLSSAAALAASEAALFGVASTGPARPVFQIDSALQGQQGVELVRLALEEKQPYAMAFVDVRMPPGWDGVETITRLWEQDPNVQIVICTAYSDYSWEQIREKLEHADRFIVLKKPFDNIEVLQLAESLTEKWRLARQEQCRLQELEHRIKERNRDLQAMESFNTQLDAANRRLTTATESADNAQVRQHHALERDLRRALQARELTVHYQPLVEIASRRVVGLEALVRWKHPTLGPVAPSEFIPIAEQSGLIVPLGEFVLRSVCEQLVRWAQEEVPVVRVAVNISAVQLERQSIGVFIRSVLRETGVQPQQLALELTESTLMKNAQEHAKALQGLRDDGVHIEIDDFGTGYSSLSSLRQLPVDTLKIDRSFISHLDTSGTDEAIVGAILALARSLGLHVVAEGVETAAQLQVLGRHGCEVAQGFYFSRPLPADECGELLLELAQRSSFTDTLRLRIVRPRPADGGDRTMRWERAK